MLGASTLSTWKGMSFADSASSFSTMACVLPGKLRSWRRSAFLCKMEQRMSYRTVCKRSAIHMDGLQRHPRVLKTIVGHTSQFTGLPRDIIQPRDPDFSSIPDHIQRGSRYMPYFKDCIGCIDGIHINACIPREKQAPFRGQKGTCTFNVMVACDFDMWFTFVSTGWEGSINDAGVFSHVTSTRSMRFPHPPEGRYYLMEKGYVHSTVHDHI